MLIKNTIIYTLMELVNKGLPFLLLPIMTRYLSQSDYGVLAVFNSFISIAAIGISLNTSGAVGVGFFRLDSLEFPKYVSNVFLIHVAATLAAFLLVYIFEDLISKHIKIPIMWIYIGLLITLFRSIINLNLVILRSQENAKLYAILEVLNTVTNVLISLILVVIFYLSWRGRLTGILVASILFGVVSFVLLLKRKFIFQTVNYEFIKDALYFGIPLIPHMLASWLRAGVDMLLIGALVGLPEAGLYSVGYQFGSILGILAIAFNNAYSPFLYKKLVAISSYEKMLLVKSTYYYFVIILLLSVCLTGASYIAIPYLLGSDFQNVRQFIFWISLGYAFQGMYYMVVNYVFFVKKTKALSMVTVSTSIFHVCLSFILINSFGAIGAAYATTISFFITFLLVWRVSARVYKMPWSLKKSAIGDT